MMNEVKSIEDQPDGTAPSEVNARMQATVQALGQALVGKFQANGNQFNVLELELKVTIMGEAIHMLTALVADLSAGKYSDVSITETMIGRIGAIVEAINESTKAPKLTIASGLPSGMRANGSKH